MAQKKSSAILNAFSARRFPRLLTLLASRGWEVILNYMGDCPVHTIFIASDYCDYDYFGFRIFSASCTLKTGVLKNTPRCVLVHTKMCIITHQGVQI